MELKGPFKISARLMPAIKIDDMWLSVEAYDRTPEGRVQYRYCLDSSDSEIEYERKDLYSGVGAPVDIQAAMGDLLVFLGTYAEYDSAMCEGEEPPFTPEILAWAQKHEYEIEDMRKLLEEGEEKFISYDYAR